MHIFISFSSSLLEARTSTHLSKTSTRRSFTALYTFSLTGNHKHTLNMLSKEGGSGEAMSMNTWKDPRNVGDAGRQNPQLKSLKGRRFYPNKDKPVSH